MAGCERRRAQLPSIRSTGGAHAVRPPPRHAHQSTRPFEKRHYNRSGRCFNERNAEQRLFISFVAVDPPCSNSHVAVSHKDLSKVSQALCFAVK
ncbi:hypothetical protein AOLI_G00099710 [Acnodon oligacanthus]